MIELKVQKIGDSLGVLFPKDVVDRLQTGDGEPLFLIEVEDGSYRLTPCDPEFVEKTSKRKQS